ncbi:PAS domain-containing sensor histidine kinase [Beijerinckiaceae bacterium RH CH11]|nr:PAS domain-containing sensor histidine kinase [Beijerinckiaceae bacterium RH CH11]VVB47604.1 PAS domain-containing sensor histidine kinase [Beijerinckiaceae bacterium RH AL8]
MSERAAPLENLADLYENAPCAYLSMLPDGCIFKANATLAEWTGQPADRLLGLRFHDLLTTGTSILYETSFAPLLVMVGAFDEVSLDLRTSGGGSLAVSASGRVVHDELGRPAFSRIALFKAMKRRLYERQLVAAKEQSQTLERVTRDLLQVERQTAELREQFIAVLGHDLRNPLASISGAARMLGKSQPQDKRKMLLDMIQSSVQRMAGLIDNVLDFARGRLGSGIPLSLDDEVELTPVLDHVVAELRVGVPGRVIESTFELPVPIRCDASRISQLVSNLLGNALTHGSVEEPVRIHADTESGDLVIWVANGGARSRPRQWTGCSSRSFAARCNRASKVSGSAFTSRPRSPRRTAGRLRSRPRPYRRGLRFACP